MHRDIQTVLFFAKLNCLSCWHTTIPASLGYFTNWIGLILTFSHDWIFFFFVCFPSLMPSDHWFKNWSNIWTEFEDELKTSNPIFRVNTNRHFNPLVFSCRLALLFRQNINLPPHNSLAFTNVHLNIDSGPIKGPSLKKYTFDLWRFPPVGYELVCRGERHSSLWTVKYESSGQLQPPCSPFISSMTS